MMTDSMMSKAATMEIPINSNGDTGTLPEDDSLEQVGHSSGSVGSRLRVTCRRYPRLVPVVVNLVKATITQTAALTDMLRTQK